jgi:hypothetical protein
VSALQKSPASAEAYAAVDVDREPDRLVPSDAVRAAFERRRPETAGTPG